MGIYLVREIYLVMGKYLVMQLYLEMKIYYLLMGIYSVMILIDFISTESHIMTHSLLVLMANERKFNNIVIKFVLRVLSKLICLSNPIDFRELIFAPKMLTWRK